MDFLYETREIIKGVDDEKKRVLASFFTSEHLCFFIAKNNPEMPHQTIHGMIKASFKVITGREMNNQDLRDIKKAYMKTRPAFLDLPEERPERREAVMKEIAENYHRVLMFDSAASKARLFRTAPREVAYEYVQRNIKRFRNRALDRTK